MIAKSDMIGVLLDVCPSFRPTWQSWLAEYANSEDELPLYCVLSDFARHLISMIERSDVTTFPDIFRAVEKLQLEGDNYVREATAVGLLEDLQNLNLHKADTEPEMFRPFLGAKLSESWDERYEFWHGVRVFKAAGLLEPKTGPAPIVDLTTIQDPELRKMIEHLYRIG